MSVITLPDHEDSYWITSAPTPGYPALRRNLTVDVAVVGGGVAGLNAAYFLKRAGLRVAVLERYQIGERVTGNTTGKITSQHNLCYTRIAKQAGYETAQLYGEANQVAIAEIEKVITREGIDCDWQRASNYVFTTSPQQVPLLKAEATLAAELGLPARFVTTTALPFAVAGAVRFAHQGKYHARKFVLGLARAVHGDGSFVFEHTHAMHLRDGSPCTLQAEGHTVNARAIIVATNVPRPLLMHAYYGLYEYPLKSYIVAAKLPARQAFKGMYISAGDQRIRSILPFTAGKDRFVMIGGESHFPGTGTSAARHERLARYAQEMLKVSEITHRWSTWDYLSNDQIPLIGRAYPWSKNVYVATGFNKWGLSTGTVAGLLLRDQILGKSNRYTSVFDSTRLRPVASLPKAALKIMRSL